MACLDSNHTPRAQFSAENKAVICHSPGGGSIFAIVADTARFSTAPTGQAVEIQSHGVLKSIRLAKDGAQLLTAL